MSLTFPKDVYPTDGVQFEFEITFPFSDPSDVFAFLIHESSGAYRRLIPNLDYTISGTTLRTRVDDFRDPWPAGYTLTILRRTRITQPSSQAMTPLVLRHRIDQLTQIMQQLREQADRTLHIGTAYPPMNLTSKVYVLLTKDDAGVALPEAREANFFNEWLDSMIVELPTMLTGQLRTPLIQYEDWPADEVVVSLPEMLTGQLRAPIIRYEDWPADEVTVSLPTMLTGSLIAPLIWYENWPADEVTVNLPTMLTGTLT